jgi:O-antigen ligase/tetratricopeptide (TPR) repeat protein
MIQFLLALILIFAPILRGAVNPCVFMAIYIIILFALLISIPGIFVNGEIRIRRTPIDIAILLFFLAAIISGLNSRYIYGSFTELIRLGNLGMVFYIAANFIRTEKDIKRVLDIVLITAGAIAIFGVLQYLGALDKSWWDNPRFLSATFVNHNHFAGYLELVIPVCLGMILTEADTGKKAIYIYLFLILSGAFLLSMSRGGWLSLSIAMTFMAWIMLKKGKARFILFMAILFFITLVIFVYNVVDAGVLFKRISSYRELDFSGRVEIWKGTLGIIRDNLFSGTGPGSFIYNFPKYRPIGLNMFVNYAHSDYLQVASEMGIFGLGIMIYIIWRIIKKALGTHMMARTNFKTWASLSLATGILSIAIHNIGDFNFYIPANAFIFTVFSGLIFNISSVREIGYKDVVLRPEPAAHRFFKVVALSAVSLAIIFMAVILAADVYSIASDRAISKNNLKSGEALAYRASMLNPFNYVYQYKLAGIYNKEAYALSDAGFLKKSEAKYKDALSLNPMDSWSWIGLADTYYGLLKASPDNYRPAELAWYSYRKGLDLDPLNAYYLKKFADFLLDMRDPGLSSQIYKKVSHVISMTKTLSSKPRGFMDAEAYRDMADLAFSNQDINKAMVFYKMAENLEDENQEAKSGQVRCYMKMFLMKKALGKYREIRQSRETKAILFASLGEYCLRKGFIESAERFVKGSIALCPENPEGLQLRYKIAKKIYGKNNSMKEFKDVLDLNSVAVSSSTWNDIGLGVKGSLISEGSIIQDVILPAGIYEINVEAKGDNANGVWPHIKVKFNSIDVIDAYVDSPDWGYYPGIIVIDYPVNRIEIIYDNDYYNSEAREDRNLHIGGLRLRTL